ncbi:hypothetical protein PEBR_35953 [Penicillium brasilianum]|uniref:Uncharacterized protein n=1 Tax=Penicillium brasilianum TaxID=104259 RepID=A0A1S9RE52_PENBI|nr:hypothetical protein PEBR_35953 [Penicillium brasilianum]
MAPTVSLKSLEASVSDLAEISSKGAVPWQVWTAIAVVACFVVLSALGLGFFFAVWYVRQQKQQVRESHPQRAENHFFTIEMKEYKADMKKWEEQQKRAQVVSDGK